MSEKSKFQGFGDVTKAKVELPKTSLPEPVKKTVRDNFSFPEDDYALVGKTVDRLLGLRFSANKSEVVRAGLKALDAIDDDELLVLFKSLEKVPRGARKKSK